MIIPTLDGNIQLFFISLVNDLMKKNINEHGLIVSRVKLFKILIVIHKHLNLRKNTCPLSHASVYVPAIVLGTVVRGIRRRG